jgi:micrococcal nuclease
MNPSPSPSRLRRALPLLVLVAGMVLGGAAVVHAVWPEDDRHGTVVRVVDGDTLVATVAGEDLTIRLLNIDTPETKHPELPVQCSGPEASAFLTRRLPAGTEIELEYDEEHTDRYGRTLAGVFEADSLISAEIAQEGLGVPVVFEPNRRFYDQVVDASEKAQLREAGLFDRSQDCTLPATIDSLQAQVEQVPESVDGDPASALASAVDVRGQADDLLSLLDEAHIGDSAFAVLGAPAMADYLDERRDDVAGLHEDASTRRDALQDAKDDFDRAEKARKTKEREEREDREEQDRMRATEKSVPSRPAPRPTSDGPGSNRSEGSQQQRSEAPSRKGPEKRDESSGSGTTGPGDSGARDKSSGSKGSGGKSSCVPYGPEYPYKGGPSYSGKRYGMPGGQTYRRCS